MAFKGTKGEWKEDLNVLSKNGQRVIESGNILIAYVQNEEIEDHECEANAKLIAAAPDLLEVSIKCLKLLREVYAEQGSYSFELEAAISKATE